MQTDMFFETYHCVLRQVSVFNPPPWHIKEKRRDFPHFGNLATSGEVSQSKSILWPQVTRRLFLLLISVRIRSICAPSSFSLIHSVATTSVCSTLFCVVSEVRTPRVIREKSEIVKLPPVFCLCLLLIGKRLIKWRTSLSLAFLSFLFGFSARGDTKLRRDKRCSSHTFLPQLLVHLFSTKDWFSVAEPQMTCSNDVSTFLSGY